MLCIYFSLCFSATCIAQETGAEDAASAAPRTLDDIRAELQKKQSEEPDAMLPGGMGGMMSGGGGGIGGLMGGYGGSRMGGGTDDMMGGYGGSRMGGGMEGMIAGMGGIPIAEPSEKQILAQIVQKVRTRLTSPKFKREEVEQQLRAALQQYFNADMEERITQFDKVKARIVDMEAKLQLRLESEGEIIDLQLKQMLHHADGLDFQVPGGTGALNVPGIGMGAGRSYGGGSYGGGAGYSGGEAGYGGGGSLGGVAGADASVVPGSESNTSVDPNSIGYDAAFGLTRVHRLAPDNLVDSDPLRTYCAVSTLAGFKQPTTDAKKMKAILLAFHNFTDLFHHFPSSSSRQFANQPPHSWRVAILPLINQAELFNEYHFDQPWDSPLNLEVAKKMPEVFRTGSSNEETTSIVMLTGDGAFDSSGKPASFANITDGTSNTIAIIQSDHEVAWTKPEDFLYSAGGPLPQLSSSRLVGMADGAVKQLTKLTDEEFRILITRSGGEVNNKELLEVPR